jgi:hypothetical protein
MLMIEETQGSRESKKLDDQDRLGRWIPEDKAQGISGNEMDQ